MEIITVLAGVPDLAQDLPLTPDTIDHLTGAAENATTPENMTDTDNVTASANPNPNVRESVSVVESVDVVAVQGSQRATLQHQLMMNGTKGQCLFSSWLLVFELKICPASSKEQALSQKLRL